MRNPAGRNDVRRSSRIRIVPFALVLAGLIALALTSIGSARARPKCFGKSADQVGTSHGDTIVAKPHAVVYAGGGNDTVKVANGDHSGHVVCGGPGDDNIKLLGGDDKASGGPGNDKIQAGNGDDLAVGDNANPNGAESGGTGKDYVGGSSGKDFLVGDNYASGNASGASPEQNVTGGAGPDTVVGDSVSIGGNASGGADDPHLAGANDNDLVVGDSLALVGVATGGGNDHVEGGPGQDLQVGDNYTRTGTASGAGKDAVQGADGGDFDIICKPANSCADVFYGDNYRAACANSRSVADNAKVSVIECENRNTTGGKPDTLTPDQGDDFMNGGLPDPDNGAGTGTTVDRCAGGKGHDIATSCKPIKDGFEETLKFPGP